MEPVNFLKPESEIRNEVIYDTEYVNQTIDTTKGAEPFEIIDSMTSEGYGQKPKKKLFNSYLCRIFKYNLKLNIFLLLMTVFKL